MPHLIIQGMTDDQIKKLNKPLVVEIARLLSCPEEEIRLEFNHSDDEELLALRAENGRLKDELQKLRKALQSLGQVNTSSQMSSRLRDALRE